MPNPYPGQTRNPNPHAEAPDFGDYVRIEQRRFGAPNEMYVYKVIGQLHSNSWVDVPVVAGTEAVPHPGQLEPCLRCICCGVDETKVKTFRVEDVTPTTDTSFN